MHLDLNRALRIGYNDHTKKVDKTGDKSENITSYSRNCSYLI